jgi:hypothetical protein
MVTRVSSTMTSFVKLDGDKVSSQYGEPTARWSGTHKSAPIVALYWLLNRLLTYWFIKEVFPTLQEQP